MSFFQPALNKKKQNNRVQKWCSQAAELLQTSQLAPFLLPLLCVPSPPATPSSALALQAIPLQQILPPKLPSSPQATFLSEGANTAPLQP